MGLDYSDARPSYFIQFTEPRAQRRVFENSGHGWNLPEQLAGSSSRAAEGDAIGKQLKRTQSGNSS